HNSSENWDSLKLSIQCTTMRLFLQCTRTLLFITREMASVMSDPTMIYCETLQSRTAQISEQCSRIWRHVTSRTSQSLDLAFLDPEFFPDMSRRTGTLHHSRNRPRPISARVPCILDRDLSIRL